VFKIYRICFSHERKPVCKRKPTSYNLDLKLGVIRGKKIGERAVEIAHAFKMDASLKSAQAIETNALYLLKHWEEKRGERRLATWPADLYQQHTPVHAARHSG
jgi:hypothetical protein